jgi:hypothetical protein
MRPTLQFKHYRCVEYPEKIGQWYMRVTEYDTLFAEIGYITYSGLFHYKFIKHNKNWISIPDSLEYTISLVDIPQPNEKWFLCS